jgi:hypothetical protein
MFIGRLLDCIATLFWGASRVPEMFALWTKLRLLISFELSTISFRLFSGLYRREASAASVLNASGQNVP